MNYDILFHDRKSIFYLRPVFVGFYTANYLLYCIVSGFWVVSSNVDGLREVYYSYVKPTKIYC